MSTPAGNKKIAAKMRERYGVDERGKSNFHKVAGSRGGRNSPGQGYFARLKAEDPEKLREITAKATAARKAKNANAAAAAQAN